MWVLPLSTGSVYSGSPNHNCCLQYMLHSLPVLHIWQRVCYMLLLLVQHLDEDGADAQRGKDSLQLCAQATHIGGVQGFLWLLRLGVLCWLGGRGATPPGGGLPSQWVSPSTGDKDPLSSPKAALSPHTLLEVPVYVHVFSKHIASYKCQRSGHTFHVMNIISVLARHP